MNMLFALQVALLFLFAVSCGSRKDTQVTLSDDQVTAIKNRLTQQCQNERASLFTAIETTTTAAMTRGQSFQEGKAFKYSIKDGNNTREEQLIVLHIGTAGLYVLETNSSATASGKVYFYTATNQSNDMNSIKQQACEQDNSITESANSYTLTTVEYDPDREDPGRSVYKTLWTINANLPLLFALLTRNYDFQQFEDDRSKSTVKKEYLIASSPDVNIDDYEDEFEAADHCIFTGTSWPGAESETNLKNDLSCTKNSFTWASDIKN
jgi:hypothetical protein